VVGRRSQRARRRENQEVGGTGLAPPSTSWQSTSWAEHISTGARVKVFCGRVPAQKAVVLAS
jgi:hypothetical protein